MAAKTLHLMFVVFSSINVNCRSIINERYIQPDPEVYMNVTQLLTSKGYPCDEYEVHTKDGFILGVQRVPHGKNARFVDPGRPVVLMMHGLLSSSASWVENPVNESLGFLMADAGFDIWMGNVRGNTYSMKHERLTPDQEEFWDFSWDEMAEYDLPAMINFVLDKTGASQIYYVGFSQGTEIAFARFSADHDLAAKIKLFVGLAPVSYLGNIKSPIRKLAPYSQDLQFLASLFGIKDFLPSSHIVKWLAENFCGHELPLLVCENIMFIFGGYDVAQMNSTRVPVYVAHEPAGTSVRNMIHYAQSVQSQKFQKFDFGYEKNIRVYNQSTPPQYDLTRVKVPIALFTGTSDWLADPADVQRMVPQLSNVVFKKVIPGWEHLDFIWAMDGPSACYDDVINLLKKTSNLV